MLIITASTSIKINYFQEIENNSTIVFRHTKNIYVYIYIRMYMNRKNSIKSKQLSNFGVILLLVNFNLERFVLILLH